MSKKLPLMILLILCILPLSVQAARTPKAKTAQRIITSYFNKYGKEYAETDYSNKNISKIQINGIQEIHFQAVLVDTFIGLNSGKIIRALVTLEKNFPVGWRVKSWEVLATAQR